MQYLQDERQLTMGEDKADNTLLVFRFQPVYLIITRKPKTSLISALSRIGGLLAFLRFSLLLKFYHEYLFHKKINKKLGPEEKGSESD